MLIFATQKFETKRVKIIEIKYKKKTTTKLIFRDIEINYVKGSPVSQKAHKRNLQFYDEKGQIHQFYTVIDTGSSSDLIDTKLAREKGLKIRPVPGQTFRSFSGAKKVSEGCVDLAFVIDDQIIEIEFSCVDMPGIELILGDPTIKFLDLRYESGEFLSQFGTKITISERKTIYYTDSNVFLLI